jgi:uncharacterized membrane-anchored protein
MLDLTARSHPLRAALSAEMHVRRLPRIESPCRLMQVVTLFGEGAGNAGRTHIAAVGDMARTPVPFGTRYAVIPLGSLTLVWEGHTEFATYTFIREGSFDAPFDAEHFAAAEPVLADLPGDIIRATQIAVLGKDSPTPDDAAIASMFNARGLIVCDVAGGGARLMSDFLLHDDGYGRLLIKDLDLQGDETAQLVTRVQELGNYRNMALLGLPVAQGLTPEITALERRLSTLAHRVSERSSSDDSLLDELSFVSAELARLAAATRYRMSATRAYGLLSADRLQSLGIATVRGYQTLADFTERRLEPALRTCESFSGRIDDLQQRAAWASALLRTRVEIALALQNRDLLESMDKRNEVQLRLQRTVEGLSVVAISYYVVSLLGYVTDVWHEIDHALLMALAVPVVLGGAWLAMRRVRRTLDAS